MIQAPDLEFAAVLPLLALAVGAFGVLVAELWLTARGTGPNRAGTALVGLSAAVLLFAGILAAQGFATGAAPSFNPAHPLIRLDRFANFATALVAGATLLACLLSNGYLQEKRLHHGEYYALLLLSAAGMALLVASVDLVSAFLGIELLSIPLYVLAGFDRGALRSNESSLKYFVLGSFASAILLYGMALVYGATGATHYGAIAAALDPTNRLAQIGVGLVIVGFTFKVAAVPFHQWAPDVYEGAPTSVTAFMATAVKIAAFVGLARIATEAFANVEGLRALFGALSAATMVIGSFMAVIQESVKRMLAYSSISHAGFLLVALAAGGDEAHAALLFYLAVYSVALLGVFAAIVSLAHRGQEAERFEDFDGLASIRPGLAAALALFLISLAGIPGTAGFFGKLLVILAAVRAEQLPLAILMALSSVVSLFYYLRLPVAMYMRPLRVRDHRERSDFLELGVLAACAVLVLWLGLAPNGLPALPGLHAVEWTRASAASLTQLP